MRKLRHYLEEGTIYFVTSVTKDRKNILLGDTARFLLITVAYHKYVLDFRLFGYVILPDHFHLLLQILEKISLSKIMKYVKGNFARKYNQFIDPDPGNRHLNVGYRSVWQREYYESAVRDEKSFIGRLNYIHNNPVKRGLVTSPDEYEFSSYHQYYGTQREKIQIPIDKILL